MSCNHEEYMRRCYELAVSAGKKGHDTFGAVLVHEPAVLCGNLITSRGMGTATPFGLAIVRYFLGEETAEKLRRKVLYQDINSGDLHR